MSEVFQMVLISTGKIKIHRGQNWSILIQGVSEFDRQTFRADFTIKNKHKTLNT
jgi:hypothetical protein